MHNNNKMFAKGSGLRCFGKRSNHSNLIEMFPGDAMVGSCNMDERLEEYAFEKANNTQDKIQREEYENYLKEQEIIRKKRLNDSR